MKAVMYKGSGKPLEIVEQEKPEPGPGELVLRVRACGICGSDIHSAQTGMFPEGVVFGHEFAGEVDAVGEGVEGDWKVGDRAISLGAFICGECPACKSGQHSDCAKLAFIGYALEIPGAYAEYVRVQAMMSMKLPDSISMADGAAVEPLAVGLNAFRDGNVKVGDDVLVIGAGPIGLACIKWAKFFGVGNVGVSDVVPSKLESAKKAGATVAIDANGTKNPVEEFVKTTGRPPAVIFECVGKPIMQHLFDISPKGCHIVSVGAGMQPEQIVAATAAIKALKLSFSIGYKPEDFGFVVEMLSNGRMTTAPLITDRISLDDVPDVFEKLKGPNEHCKVIIEP